jgi:hypothetical protein
MITIPNSEQQRFKSLLLGQAKRFGLTPEEYLRKIWYHEEATKLGEYVAMVLLEELLPHAKETEEKEMVEA